MNDQEEKKIIVEFTTANGKVCEVSEESFRSAERWLKKQNEHDTLEEVEQRTEGNLTHFYIDLMFHV